MKRSISRWGGVLIFTVLIILGEAGFSQEKLKPFVLAWKGQSAMAEKAAEVRSALQVEGFEIAGTYSPYANATVIAVTNDALKSAAAKSEQGGYGAVARVTLTQVGEELQVAYTNLPYMAAAYRMTENLDGVADSLKKALGELGAFGSEDGLSANDLREYHYMFGMEYFDEPSTLAEYDSHAQAIKAVEDGLSKKQGGVSKVYRVDIPGKKEVVFGVALTTECSGDEHIMSLIDFLPTRSTPHLPYEILVSEKTVYALYGRFRIAINFPDLSMMGDNSFFSIMCAPDEIEEALEKAAGKKDG